MLRLSKAISFKLPAAPQLPPGGVAGRLNHFTGERFDSAVTLASFMSLTIDTDRLRNHPLTFRTFLDHDYVAEVDGLRAGWILSDNANDTRTWWWTMTGPCCGHARISSHGKSSSLEDAKEQFRQAFEKWRQWAVSEEEPVRWFGAGFHVAESSFLPRQP